MKKKLISLLSVAALITCLMSGCTGTTQDSSGDTEDSESTGEAVTILYTNDVHSYIANTVEDADGNETPGLTYATVAALRQNLIDAGENVLLVDAGDHIQGTAYGSTDEGATIIQLMNAAGYQLATLGNHEFDYGMDRIFEIMEKEADFSYVSCNFYNTETNETILPAYKVLEAGGVKIAFVGISTPETITTSTPAFFMDEAQENYLYNFYAGENGEELYSKVQEAIDAASEEADYVIALGHLGVSPSSGAYTSANVIANTSGLTAFIDGHSHTTMESQMVTDKDGNQVLLTQTGSYFSAIGQMTIAADGSVSTKFITEYDRVDEDVQATTDEWAAEITDKLGSVIAYTPQTYYIYDPEDPETRIVRRSETNLGDFCADAIYYYFNEVQELECDGAIMNGGGVRAQVGEGEFTYLSAQTVEPFGNVMCMVEMSGQQLLDALEKGASAVGVTDENGNPSENGGFMHVAGIKYEIDTSIASTITVNENNEWVSGPSGEYRVKNVEIYDRETGEYVPIDLSKTYRIAGSNYTLLNSGDGFTMFADCTPIVDYVSEDYMVLSSYAQSFAIGETNYPTLTTENSPLASYDGYLIDYENPLGAGRITIN